MLDIEQAKQRQHEYYAANDYAHGVNTITDFAFEDPARVPELFRNFAVEYFGLERYRRVDLEKLNTVLNDLWQGPGTAAVISDLVWDIRIARRQGKTDVSAVFKNLDTPTIDSDLGAATDE